MGTAHTTDQASWMLTCLLLWLCSLPLVGLIVLPWLGPRIAVTVAVALLTLAITACYTICIRRGPNLNRTAAMDERHDNPSAQEERS